MNTTNEKSVFEKRVEVLQEKMTQKSLDYLFLPVSLNQRYVTGLNLKKRDRLMAAVIPQKGEIALVIPGFELEGVQEGVRVASAKFMPWQEQENPYEMIATIIDSPKPRIGVESTAWFSEYDKLSAVLPSATFVDAASLLAAMRIRKSDWEKERIKKAIDIIDEAREAMFARLKEGMTETEACEILRSEGVLRGGENPHPHGAHFGRNSSFPHGGTEEIALTKDMVIMVDAGVACDGYQSDITRTTVFGEFPEGFEEIFGVLVKAQKKALELVGPGVPAENVDRAAREEIKKAGFELTHRVGHGLGLDMHEPPWIGPGQKDPLEVGMVFTVEPGIYLSGQYGVRIEDNVIVTEDGCEILSRPVEEFKPL